MIKEIQQLVKQIEGYLSDKTGFETEINHKGVLIKVTNPNGSSTEYDGYEMLLYALGSRKLGHEITLNIKKDSDGNEQFSINTEAKFDVTEYIKSVNQKLTTFETDNIKSVFIAENIAGNAYPISLVTIYNDGKWMRSDLTISEVFYAGAFELNIDLQDGAFVYPKLRELVAKVLKEIEEEQE